MTEKQQPNIRAWLAWGLGALFFLIEYFVRISPSVISNQLMAAFSVKAFALGGLSAFFYYAYASMQIPAGVIVDRYGSYKPLILATLCCALGSWLFAIAPSIVISYISRLIIGFGAAFAFVCTLKLISIWFPKGKFALLAGITQALGMVGATIGDAPLSILFHHFGWRRTMLAIAILFVLLSIAIVFIVKEAGPGTNKPISKPIPSYSMINALKQVLSNPQTWLNGLFIGLLYGPTATFAEQWGVPFLSAANRLSGTWAAFDVGLVFIGMAIGCPISGWLTNRLKSHVLLMKLSAFFSLILLSFIIYVNHFVGLSNTLTALMLFLYGLANSGIVPSYALAAKINPDKLTGLAIGFTNMASIIIGSIFIPIIGFILDHLWSGKIFHHVPIYTNISYMIALTILPISLLLAFMVSFVIRDKA